MAETAMLHVRIESEMKEQASEALAAIGLSVSDAVRLLLRRVVAEQALPLELKVPNAETRKAIAQARAMHRAKRARFPTAGKLFDALEKQGK